MNTDNTKLFEEWEARLKEDGLASIDHTYKGTIYVESERLGGHRTLSLTGGIPGDETPAWLIVYDEYQKEPDISQERALALVAALPKPIRDLGERKVQQDGLSRSDAQTLRRLLSFFSWERLNQKLTGGEDT